MDLSVLTLSVPPWRWTRRRCRWCPPPCQTQSPPTCWCRSLSRSGQSRRSWCTSAAQWRCRSRVETQRRTGRKWWPWQRWWRSASRTGWWRPGSWWASCRPENPVEPSGRRPGPRPERLGRLPLSSLGDVQNKNILWNLPSDSQPEEEIFLFNIRLLLRAWITDWILNSIAQTLQMNPLWSIYLERPLLCLENIAASMYHTKIID